MAFSKAFERELNSLFHERAHWLRRRLGAKGAGKPPRFGRKKVNVGIKKLQVIASNALARQLARLGSRRLSTHRGRAGASDDVNAESTSGSSQDAPQRAR
jgi:hypothetical protein